MIALPRSRSALSNPADRLLDPEALETPRRLSHEEHRAVAGPDWTWTHHDHDEERFDD